MTVEVVGRARQVLHDIYKFIARAPRYARYPVGQTGQASGSQSFQTCVARSHGDGGPLRCARPGPARSVFWEATYVPFASLHATRDPWLPHSPNQLEQIFEQDLSRTKPDKTKLCLARIRFEASACV